MRLARASGRDEAGRLVPDALVRVCFVPSGAGEIAAIGNANPKGYRLFPAAQAGYIPRQVRTRGEADGKGSSDQDRG